MTLPPQAYTSQDAAVASYPAADLINGLSDVIYNLVKVQNPGSSTNLKIVSSDMSGQFVAANGYNSTANDAFDLGPFQTTRIIDGFVSLWGQQNGTSGTPTMTAQLFHVESDGTTETQLGADGSSGSTTSDIAYNITFTVPRTQFKVGEFLRVKIDMSDGTLYISIDPTEISPASIAHTRLTVQYEVDLV